MVLCCGVVWRWERLFVDLPGAVARLLLLLRCGSAAAAAGIRAVIVHSLLLCPEIPLVSLDPRCDCAQFAAVLWISPDDR